MNKHEIEARNKKEAGYSCSASINMTFVKDLKISEDYPAPRSIEGKCGALLVALKILDEMGHGNKKDEFEKEFIKRFGYSKCVDLMKHEARCTDYVGESTKMLDEILNNVI